MRTGARIAALGAALGGAAFGLVRLQRGRDGGLGRIMGCDVGRLIGGGCRVELDTEVDEDHAFTAVLTCNGEERGEIEVLEEFGNEWVVQWIGVDKPFRRRGFATKLYEFAAREACRRGGPLTAGTRVGEGSEGFWQKQIRKRRARIVGDDIKLRCPAPRNLSQALGDFFTPKSALPPGYRIRAVQPDTTRDAIAFDLLHEGFPAGHIELVPSSMDDEDVYLVHSVEVNATRRRRGLGTRLYERAAEEACRRGAAALVSNDRISDASRGFWKKQIRKGRAEVVGTDPTGEEIISLPCPAPKSLARMGNLGGFGYAPAECEIENFPTRGDEGLKVLNLICRGHEVGTVTLSESEMDDEPVWIVEGIEIEPRFRRRRLGTKLYEAAAQAACRDGTALISNNRTSRKSEAFWKKQVRKGRAYVAGTDPAGKQIIALPCPAPKSLARLGGLPPNAELNVKEEPRRSDIIPPGFEICARQPGGHPFGCITARRADWLKKEPGPTPFEVNGVWVASGLQRRGIATKLYEAAAAEACKRGAPLQSDMERSPEADRFWRKQKRKGRAVPMKRILVDEEVNFFRLPCPAPADLSKALSGASGALGRAPIKARCEPIFTPQELKSLPPRFRQDNPKKCFFRKRGRFRAAKFRNKREPFRFLIVHPSTKRPGRCQKTEFDDRGAVGDREFATCAEAVADISPRQWRLDKVVK